VYIIHNETLKCRSLTLAGQNWVYYYQLGLPNISAAEILDSQLLTQIFPEKIMPPFRVSVFMAEGKKVDSHDHGVKPGGHADAICNVTLKDFIHAVYVFIAPRDHKRDNLPKRTMNVLTEFLDVVLILGHSYCLHKLRWRLAIRQRPVSGGELSAPLQAP
jgi:hypothetical protein